MGKLKNKHSSLKIDGKPDLNHGCCSDQFPWFSFRFLTKNRKYNLDGLRAGSEREDVLWGLNQRLIELSSEDWTYWLQRPKQNGVETLSYQELNFKASMDEKLAGDATIYVFRFDTRKHDGGRIIGFKESPCAVLHIIGFDFDFSAYNHGK